LLPRSHISSKWTSTPMNSDSEMPQDNHGMY
jgi:hypothetical protein